MMGCFGMQWHQLDHMQTICISLQTDNQHPITRFLQAGSSSCRPTNSVKALNAVAVNPQQIELIEFLLEMQ